MNPALEFLSVIVFIVASGFGAWAVTGGPGKRQLAKTGQINRGGPVTVILVSTFMLIIIGVGVYFLVAN
jgi:hypothetical protein